MDLTITGKQAGEKGINAVIHYEDAEGKEEQLKETIPLTVLGAAFVAAVSYLIILLLSRRIRGISAYALITE